MFEEPLSLGVKTTTARVKAIGRVGDHFSAFGMTFVITGIVQITEQVLRDSFWKQEGFSSPEELVKTWVGLHFIIGFVPNKVVVLHQFVLDPTCKWEMFINPPKSKCRRRRSVHNMSHSFTLEELCIGLSTDPIRPGRCTKLALHIGPCSWELIL
ncbi:hypothetical protein LCGC14_0381490 [marine sediment metagenome]|uniref:Uncharacterized protein n=1 Tax=marine sediment metagenome TaxID=412755 RepID=A0A0F9TKA5_9ZZZZ